jgi:hypothetical protein
MEKKNNDISMTMKSQTRMYDQVYQFLSRGTEFVDKRHHQVLSWMVTALLGSLSLNQNEWEPYVESRAKQAQSYQRRWHRFLSNSRVVIENIYGSLVRAAIYSWQNQRIYVALDTTVLWNQYCMVHFSVVCGGRALPLMWISLEHPSASVAFETYKPLLERALEQLSDFQEVVLLADRGFANQEFVRWLKKSPWHWLIRVPCDTAIYGVHKRGFARQVRQLFPAKGEAKLYHNVQVWEAREECNLALASMRGVKEQWGIITDEPPTLQTFWQYGSRFCIEELFLDSKSGVFGLEGSQVRNGTALERLYLVVAIALLFATVTGMAVQRSGVRRQVDTHWRRGLSYLKIGLRWLKGVVHKNRQFLPLCELFYHDPEPCFASAKAKKKFLEQFSVERIRTFYYST